MQSGVWEIQVPTRREVVTPDLVIAPLFGFDRDRYRLGNGGGCRATQPASWKQSIPNRMTFPWTKS
jgi:hypothetical protein